MKKNDVIGFLLLFIASFVKGDENCSNNGIWKNGTCICNPGFGGNECQHCDGRFVLTDTQGKVSDGPGKQHFSNCLGVINSPPSNNSVVRLRFDSIAISCHCDFLTVYDGDSLYAPVLATFNGDLLPTQTQEVVSTSSSVALKFYNDGTDFVDPGYHITYSVEENHELESNFTSPDISNFDAWSRYSWNNSSLTGRASSAAVAMDGYLYVYGGIEFGEPVAGYDLMRLNLSSYVWSEAGLDQNDNSTSFPEPRHGHVMVVWENSLLVHGGAFLNYNITNEIWSFDVKENEWQNFDGNASRNAPYLMGHSAHVIDDVMLTFFGYSPLWEISNFVFEMDLATKQWSKIATKGPLPKATYQHASVLDEMNRLVYIHGGYNNEASSNLYSYNIDYQEWTILPSAPRSAYLHSAVMLGSNVYVFGGKVDHQNCHITCSDIYTIMYDTVCMRWSSVEEDELITSDRFGHSAVQLNDKTMLLYGGYDGTMLRDAITYTAPDPINCDELNERDCDGNNNNCTWSGTQCMPDCLGDDTACEGLCTAQSSCVNCISTPCSCCYDHQQYQQCVFHNETSEVEDEACGYNNTACSNEEWRYCSEMQTCSACDEAGCLWVQNGGYCAIKEGNETSPECREPCSIKNNCGDCVSQSECSWCKTTETCFRRGTTAIYFSYGECLDYADTINSCSNDYCSQRQSCDDCFEDFHCGWCSFVSETGFGACYPGSLTGPIDQYNTCRETEWRFEQCPACQCNGHSYCNKSTPSVCVSCEKGTTGEKCEECDTLYYGDARNGKNCSYCECNGHAEDCSKEGDCYCDVEGIEGRNCDTCYRSFNGNPINDTCRFTMEVMTKYNFNLIRENSAVNKFNFEACPPYKADVTVNIEITGSQNQTVDVYITTNTSTGANYSFIGEYDNVTHLQKALSQHDYQFGEASRRCIQIYISKIELPVQITIWLYQPYINIWMLVGIFFITLLILLVVSGLLWKIYSIIARARRRRIIQVEMERLAERPLSFVNLDTDNLDGISLTEQKCDDDQQIVKTIAEEHCHDGRANVCTVLLWLPNQDIGSRIAFGSCLAINTSPEKDFKGKAFGNKKKERGIENPNYTPDSA